MVPHLSKEIEASYNNRFLKSPNNIIKLAKIFIKLFDMIPILSEKSSLEEKNIGFTVED